MEPTTEKRRFTVGKKYTNDRLMKNLYRCQVVGDNDLFTCFKQLKVMFMKVARAAGGRYALHFHIVHSLLLSCLI